MNSGERDGIGVIVVGSLSDPVYSYEDETGRQFHWNVNAALAFAQARNAVFTISLSDMGVTIQIVRKQYYGLDEAHALTTDLSRPLLFVPIGEKVWLIDGWHRVAKALLTGVDVLFAYFLTQEEADACLLLTLPPGQGLDWGQNDTTTQGAPNGNQRYRRKEHVILPGLSEHVCGNAEDSAEIGESGADAECRDERGRRGGAMRPL